MQNYIIRYVETLKARIEPTGCSIAQAITAELARYDRATLIKLRDAALDLQRIVELEVQRQDDADVQDVAEWTDFNSKPPSKLNVGDYTRMDCDR